MAYAPPTDTVGPLTIEIEQPALGAYGAGGNLELTSQNLAIPVIVSLRNSGAAPLRGTLRVTVIDGWSIAPGRAAFEVPARGRGEVRFTARAAAGSYNAHYPVHAFAEFTHEGKPLAAHAVMVLQTRYPDPPRADPGIEWKPVALASGSGIPLWRMPVRREFARTVSGPSLVPRREHFEAASPVEYRESRGEIVMKLGPREPSRRENVRSASVEFPVALPAANRIQLTFGAGATGPALFRARVRPFEGGEARVVFAQTSAPDYKADLTEFAGKSVVVELEAEAESSAEARWIRPALFAGGAAASPGSAGGVRELGSAGAYKAKVRPGKRGILDAEVSFDDGTRSLSFQGFNVRVLGDSLAESPSVSSLSGVADESSGGRLRLRHKFESWAGGFDLLSELWVEGPALRARLWLENAPAPKPWRAVYIEEARAGAWTQALDRVYGGPGNVIDKPRSFRLSFDGHSLATSFAGFEFANGVSMIQALDVPPDSLEVQIERKIATLSTPHTQTITFIPGSNVWDGVKAWRAMDGLKASAGVPKLASRFVFDYWGNEKYSAAARLLARAFRYGLTDSAVVWHNWQRWGYDYRLPDVYPPDPARGTVEDFAAMVRECTEAGVRFAPHDNYIDFYPDFDGFSYKDIVFEADGAPKRAWFHFARQAQSYRARPDRVRPFVERNVKLVKSGLAPTAYFIDVWSSIAPYDFWTDDGRFVDRSVTRKAWGEAFGWIRDFLGDDAPQISEAGHDQLIGWLDGAQANHLRVDTEAESFTWKIGAKDAERIPWFDAAHHDKFILHGAGYPDRYAAGLDEATHGIYSDDYIATEVLTGRPAMVADLFNRDVVRKYWLLHDVMRGLALRRIGAVEFVEGDIHRQRVKWDNGAEIFVNRSDYVYHARVPVAGGEVESAIERRGGKTVEWTRSPESVYVNGRGSEATVAGVTTPGGVRVAREGAAIVVTPLPESGAVAVKLAPGSLPWKVAAAPRRIEAISEQGKVVGVRSLAKAGAEITLACEPGVFAYRIH